MYRYIMYASGICLISFVHVFWISMYCALSERQAPQFVILILLTTSNFLQCFARDMNVSFVATVWTNTKEAYGRLSLSGLQAHVRRKLTYKVI